MKKNKHSELKKEEKELKELAKNKRKEEKQKAKEEKEKLNSSKNKEKKDRKENGFSPLGGFFGKHFNEGGCNLGAQTFFHKCVSWMERKNETDTNSRLRIHEEGIYRVCGPVSGINKIKETANGDPVNFQIDPSEEVHNVTGVLKLFLREMPEPLVPYNLYDDFIEAGGSPKLIRDESIQSIVHKLPPDNKVIFDILFYHLHKIQKNSAINMMDAKNLAIVFAPNLLRPMEDSPGTVITDSPAANSLVTCIITKPDLYLHPFVIASPRTAYAFNDIEEEETKYPAPMRKGGTVKVRDMRRSVIVPLYDVEARMNELKTAASLVLPPTGPPPPLIAAPPPPLRQVLSDSTIARRRSQRSATISSSLPSRGSRGKIELLEEPTEIADAIIIESSTEKDILLPQILVATSDPTPTKRSARSKKKKTHSDKPRTDRSERKRKEKTKSTKKHVEEENGEIIKTKKPAKEENNEEKTTKKPRKEENNEEKTTKKSVEEENGEEKITKYPGEEESGEEKTIKYPVEEENGEEITTKRPVENVEEITTDDIVEKNVEEITTDDSHHINEAPVGVEEPLPL